MMTMKKTIIWLSLFSISMAFMESAVVIYLRALYYPEGFDFPLAPIEPTIAITELIREAATIIMLIGIGVTTGKNATQRFAYFIYCFAIWDIFYYVFLKVILGWPVSFLTWDILFLIPVTWVGPVIAPIIISLTMILLAFLLVHFNKKNEALKLNRMEWWLLIGGSLTVITSFVWDYCDFILTHHSFSEIWSIQSDTLFELAQNYIPRKFNWIIFWLGEIILLLGVGFFYRRSKRMLINF